MSDTPVIQWHTDDLREQGRDYPEWYADETPWRHNLICSVSYRDRMIQVFCDGNMDIRSFKDGEVYATARIPDQLGSLNIHNDDDIVNSMDGDLVVAYENPWFDLYAEYEPTGTAWHMDCVSTTLTEALEWAMKMIHDPFPDEDEE